MGISHGPPDLTPYDYFLWGHLKTNVFETKPKTIVNLIQRIQDEVATIPVEMLREVSVSGPDLNACVETEAILRALFSKHKFSNWHKTKWLFICFSIITNK
jgi:hypothetical protein